MELPEDIAAMEVSECGRTTSCLKICPRYVSERNFKLRLPILGKSEQRETLWDWNNSLAGNLMLRGCEPETWLKTSFRHSSFQADFPRSSSVVRITDSHSEDPGSNPGSSNFFHCLWASIDRFLAPRIFHKNLLVFRWFKPDFLFKNFHSFSINSLKLWFPFLLFILLDNLKSALKQKLHNKL